MQRFDRKHGRLHARFDQFRQRLRYKTSAAFLSNFGIEGSDREHMKLGAVLIRRRHALATFSKTSAQRADTSSQSKRLECIAAACDMRARSATSCANTSNFRPSSSSFA